MKTIKFIEKDQEPLVKIIFPYADHVNHAGNGGIEIPAYYYDLLKDHITEYYGTPLKNGEKVILPAKMEYYSELHGDVLYIMDNKIHYELKIGHE